MGVHCTRGARPRNETGLTATVGCLDGLCHLANWTGGLVYRANPGQAQHPRHLRGTRRERLNSTQMGGTSISFRPLTCTYAPCGPSARVDELAKSKKGTHPKIFTSRFREQAELVAVDASGSDATVFKWNFTVRAPLRFGTVPGWDAAKEAARARMPARYYVGEPTATARLRLDRPKLFEHYHGPASRIEFAVHVFQAQAQAPGGGGGEPVAAAPAGKRTVTPPGKLLVDTEGGTLANLTARARQDSVQDGVRGSAQGRRHESPVGCLPDFVSSIDPHVVGPACGASCHTRRWWQTESNWPPLVKSYSLAMGRPCVRYA